MGLLSEDPVSPQDTTNPTDTAPTDSTDSAGGDSGDSSGKVDPQVVEAITIATVETIAASASNAMANLYQHQVNHARRLDALNEASHAQMLKRFASVDVVESLSTKKLFQGEADSSITSLLAQLSAAQQGAKIAQSTPGGLAMEITQVGSAISSLQTMIGGLVALLQVTLKQGGGNTAPMMLQKSNPAPKQAKPKQDVAELEEDDADVKYPRVTVRFNNK